MPVSASLGVVSTVSTCVDGILLLACKKYKKKLLKCYELIDKITSSLPTFQVLISLSLNDDSVIDAKEFHKLQTLPNNDDFYSILNDEHISDTQYVDAIKVWNTFKLKIMGEYHDFQTFFDVFKNSRKTCMQYYKLGPCHYFTSPGLSWDAMLKMTDIKLE